MTDVKTPRALRAEYSMYVLQAWIQNGSRDGMINDYLRPKIACLPMYQLPPKNIVREHLFIYLFIANICGIHTIWLLRHSVIHCVP